MEIDNDSGEREKVGLAGTGMGAMCFHAGCGWNAISTGSRNRWDHGGDGAVDPLGAATVANASVSIKNQGTNETRIAKTGADGVYSMPLLPPGNYQVTVEAAGFAKAVTGVVSLSVSQTVPDRCKPEFGPIGTSH